MINENQTNHLLAVDIFEGKDYFWPHIDTVVYVQVDNLNKYSAVRYESDNPVYNEYFVFEFNCTLQQFLDKTIEISLIRPGKCWLNSKTLGTISMDVATVWTHNDHAIRQKWAILTSTNKYKALINVGYLKISLSIMNKAELPLMKDVNESYTDDIEENLFMKHNSMLLTTNRQKVNYVFTIYHGENILCDKISKKKIVVPNIFIKVYFIGVNFETMIKYGTNNPVWNQQFRITELFPPLFQRIRIELRNSTRIQSKLLAVQYLQLGSVSDLNSNEFLPCFGPSFIHFYHNDTYIGSILISLETETKEGIVSLLKTCKMEFIHQPFQNELWLEETYIIFVMLNNVSMIHNQFGKNEIVFKIKMGNDNSKWNVSNPYKPASLNDKYYSYIDFEEYLPCLHSVQTLPDIKDRVRIVNMIMKILAVLKESIRDIDRIFRRHSQISNDLLTYITTVVDKVSTACIKFADISRSYSLNNLNQLDKNSYQLRLKRIESIEKTCQTLSKSTDIRFILKKLVNFLKNFEIIAKESQDCWPIINLEMKTGSNYYNYQIHAGDILYSINHFDKGEFCDSFQNLLLETNSKSSKSKRTINDLIICNVNCFLWMSTLKQFNYCSERLKEFGFTVKNAVDNNIPILMNSNKKINYFMCKVHVLQGKLDPGFDTNGLCDPFFKITVDKVTKQSSIKNQTLIPVWNELFEFNNIQLLGDRKTIESNIPIILIEVYDQDKYFKVQMVGKILIKPSLIFLGDRNRPEIKFVWYTIDSLSDITGDILLAVQFEQIMNKINDSEDNEMKFRASGIVPKNLLPAMSLYTIEIYFWGVRNLKKVSFQSIKSPKFVFVCSDANVEAVTYGGSSHNQNFLDPIKTITVLLPDDYYFAPPILITMFDKRLLGYCAFCGSNTSSVNNYMYKPLETEIREKTLKLNIASTLDKNENQSNVNVMNNFVITNFAFSRNYTDPTQSPYQYLEWWTIFYASLNNSSNIFNIRESLKIKVYNNELELQPEFESFNDILQNFKIYYGKRSDDSHIDEEHLTGTLKGSIKIYRNVYISSKYITDSGVSLNSGIFSKYPKNDQLKFLLRVYVVRGQNLKPKDACGKCDPYISIKIGSQVVHDVQNYVPGQLNPNFGKCYEFNCTFPDDYFLTISVWDWDRTSRDDLIGETHIDLENRFYTKHRAFVGFPGEYHTKGPLIWRHEKPPSQILENLCYQYKLNKPYYTSDSVTVALCRFSLKYEAHKNYDSFESLKEELSLIVLNNWHKIPIIGRHFVPYHVETRSLYHPNKSGVVQGKLQLWIELLPGVDIFFPPAVNISPPKPKQYQLRVIIWNTKDVALTENDFFLGEKVSDIFVKGWMTNSKNSQVTDIHYKSLTGEGNFNWRFIFDFNYDSIENKIIESTKENLLALQTTEESYPCKVHLQVWDNDVFTNDDFIGTVSLELIRFPLGAPNHMKCNLNQLSNSATNVNLFKTKRIKGWWPFKSVENGREILTGKFEAEFQLYTLGEASAEPVGFGRDPPQPLPQPNRPSLSTTWLSYYLTVLKNMICGGRNKWRTIRICFLIFVFIFIIMLVLSIPGHIARKIIGS